MSTRRIVWLCVLLLAAGLTLVAVAEEPEKPADPRVVGKATKLDGPGPQPATRGQKWITYDDGTREAWGTDYNGGTVGNTFVQTNTNWQSFYCDGISAYRQYITGMFFTGYAGKNTAGTALTGYEDDYFGNTGSGTGWLTFDAATTTGSFFGNSTFTWADTAYIAGYDSDPLGVDTNGGTPHMGFSLGTYSGSGYQKEDFNAMLRARFNGTGVPVELMTFSVD